MMTCPNQSTTVTIPFPTGTATVVPLDSNTCNPLDATVVQVQLTSAAGPALNGSSKPSLTADSSGLHFSANGAAFGSTGTLFFTYTPNGKTWTMTFTIGGVVSPVGSTTTP